MSILKPPFSSPPYIRLLQSCLSMDQLQQIHAQITTFGLSRFSYITSKILAFCALNDAGQISYAHTLFHQIRTPTVFDFNTMIMGYSKISNPDMGFSVYVKMRSNGVDPNARTFPLLAKASASVCSLSQVYSQVVKFGHCCDVYVVSSFISMYARFGDIRLAFQIFDESLYTNVVCYTSLISGYCCNGCVDEARQLFDSMSDRNEVCCSAMVSGYIRNEHYKEAIELFRELRGCGDVKFNKSLLVSVLTACAAAGAFKEGQIVHSYLQDNYFQYELELGTALIDFYTKCGDIETAKGIFEKMTSKDVTTWTAMILGLAVNGRNDMALELFREMERTGPKPNAVTFIGVLAACNQKTPMNEAWQLFGRMSKIYGIEPLIEHYGCMVDLLARAGQIKRADILIKCMPMEPDGAIWGSFLNGCLIHGDSELGLRAGKVLIELEPQHSGRYVLLANMYATLGSWESVMRLRKMMKVKQVAAIPGWSSIEFDGIINRFTVDDKSHSQMKDIYQLLIQLNQESLSSTHDSVIEDAVQQL